LVLTGESVTIDGEHSPVDDRVSVSPEGAAEITRLIETFASLATSQLKMFLVIGEQRIRVQPELAITLMPLLRSAAAAGS
jgi:hypothetical protein